MRRIAVLTVCLLVLMPALDAAQAAGRTGTVDSSWVSRTSGGKKESSFRVASIKRLYANFVWKTPAAPNQQLRIEWRDPGGTLRAVWKNKTIAGDKKGTRLFAWVVSDVVKGKPGSWRAVLTVGTTRIGTAKFKIVA
jgi:hypothetical protein